MENETLELIIDTEDNYKNNLSLYYIHPLRLSLVKCLSDNQFNACYIKNTSIDYISSSNLSYLIRKLNPKSVLEVTIFQPISVMQDYDAKQVEANAKLAGFIDIETSNLTFIDYKSEKKIQTMTVTCVKPERKVDEAAVEPAETNAYKRGFTAKPVSRSSSNNKIISKEYTPSKLARTPTRK
jgi:hypothetical protein